MKNEVKSEITFMLDHYLSSVEKWFYDIRDPKYNDRLDNIRDDNPNKAMAISIRAGDYGGIRDFIVAFEKILFRNFDLENLGESEVNLIENYQSNYKDKLSFLKKLIDAYAAGRHENVIQANFYKHLIGSLEEIVDKTHPAFKNKEVFLAKKAIVSINPLPDGAVTSKEISYAPKPLFLKSPEKVIAGFQFIADEGFCKISDVTAFVLDAFHFPSQYEIRPMDKYYYVVWNKPSHTLTVLIRELKNKGMITNTKSELIEWVSVLLPFISKDSIRKYMSSNDKKLSEKKSIDIQVFR